MSARAFVGFVFMILISITAQAQSIDEGESLLKKGNLSEARSMFESMIKQNDNNARAHCDLGKIFLSRQYQNRDIDMAADEFEKATDIDSHNAEYQFLYGAAIGEKAQSSGMIKQAFLAPKIKKAFSRAVELDPSLIEARIGLAQYYLIAPSIMGGDESAGWKQLDEVIKLDELTGRTVKANMLLREKKNSEAENEYTILTSSRPNDWRVWHRYGYFCLRLNLYDDAISHFNKYIALRPDTADSFQSLAEALIKKGALNEAMSNLNRSFSLDKNYVPAIVSLGEVYQAQGQKQKAKETYQWAATLISDDRSKKQIEIKIKEVE